MSLESLTSKNAKIALVGLGYVGLPLAVAFDSVAEVIGYDISERKIEDLKRGIDTTGEIASMDLASSDIEFTTDAGMQKKAAFIIVTVPTPIHKSNRTRHRFKGLDSHTDGVRLFLVNPVGYLEFLSLQQGASLIITDSGGIQEETTYLGGPCLTVRENTERPITVIVGTNVLTGQNMNKLKSIVFKILDGDAKQGAIPPLWDGKASERIADVVC